MRLPRANAALLVLVGEGFLSRLSFGLVSFALPLYAHRLGLSVAAIGLLLSLNLMVAIALKPLMGAWADRFGLKPSLTVAIALRSVVSLLLALATLPWHLFATRSIHGISISMRDPAASAMIAKHGGEKAIASAFAWYQTAKSVAGALGKTAAGLILALTASNFSLVFGIAFVLSALPVVLVARFVREGSKDEARPNATDIAGFSPQRKGADPKTEREARPPMLRFAGLGFLISGTAYMLANLFPLLAVEYAGLSEAQAGLIYSFSAVVVLAGPVFGWLSDNVSRRLVLSLRSVANTLSSAIFLVAPNFAGMASGKVVDDLGKAAFRPAWGAMMAHISRLDPARRAWTMGHLSSADDAGEIAGPLLAGVLWNLWGVPVLLGARIALAAVTELYAVRMDRSLYRLREHTPGSASKPRIEALPTGRR